jgi:hypothetical protein
MGSGSMSFPLIKSVLKGVNVLYVCIGSWNTVSCVALVKMSLYYTVVQVILPRKASLALCWPTPCLSS